MYEGCLLCKKVELLLAGENVIEIEVFNLKRDYPLVSS